MDSITLNIRKVNMFRKFATASISSMVCLSLFVIYMSRNTPPMRSDCDIDSNKIKDSITRHLVIADDRFEGRMAGTKGLALAADYVAEQFGKRNLLRYDTDYFEDIDTSVDGNTMDYGQNKRVVEFKLRNVIGYHKVNGSDEYMIIGAHLDHVGKEDGSFHYGRLGHTQEDKIYNGADDNASGIAVMLAILDNIHIIKPKYNIVFMAFDAEECGLYGSKAHLIRKKATGNANVYIGMINLDMVGRSVMSVFHSDHQVFSDISPDIRKVLPKHVGMVMQWLDINDLQGDSDHSSFRDVGIPHLFFFSGLHREYHKTSDEVHLLDTNNMAKLSHLILHMLDKK